MGTITRLLPQPTLLLRIESKMSEAGATKHAAMTWSIVVSTCPNWLQYSGRVTSSITSVSTSTMALFTPMDTPKIFRLQVG